MGVTRIRMRKFKHRLMMSFAGVVLVVGVIGISGCGNGETKEAEISAEQRQVLNELIDNKNYSELALETVDEREKNPELKAMYYFASAMKSKLDGDVAMVNSYIEDIPEEYREYYSELIKNEKIDYEDLEIANNEADDKTNYENIPPKIGITREQLKVSSWGLPEDINKTTTEHGVSEQWVYGDGKYVYLDDGIVTSIQE